MQPSAKSIIQLCCAWFGRNRPKTRPFQPSVLSVRRSPPSRLVSALRLLRRPKLDISLPIVYTNHNLYRFPPFFLADRMQTTVELPARNPAIYPDYIDHEHSSKDTVQV